VNRLKCEEYDMTFSSRKTVVGFGLITILIAVSLFMGVSDANAKKKAAKIKLDGVTTLAILPFTCQPIGGMEIMDPEKISTKEFRKIFKKKCKLTLIDFEVIDNATSVKKLSMTKPVDAKQASSIGSELGADAVMTGHLRSIDQKTDEVKIMYELEIVKVDTGDVLFSESMEKAVYDSTRDFKRGIFASPELLSERVARGVAKKLIKRIK
jgi:TolB-like protein